MSCQKGLRVPSGMQTRKRWNGRLSRSIRPKSDPLCHRAGQFQSGWEGKRMSYFDEVYESVLPHRAVAVYMYLRDRAGKTGCCWPGINTIARDLKLSRSTIKRALADLEMAGRMVREARFRAGEHWQKWWHQYPPPPGGLRKCFPPK